MKTKKTKLFVLFALVASLVVTMACLFTACGDEEEKPTNFAITWTVPEDVTVTVDGADGKPETWAADTDLVFAVTAPTGYEATVKNGTTTLKAGDNGKYTVKVSKDVTIKITTAKVLNSIEVEVLEEKAYFEDYVVDKSTLKVTAKYALGDEVLSADDYSITYANGNTAFAEGDTSFTVTFNGQSKVVNLATAVKTAQDFESAALDVDVEGNPVLVLTGHYNAGDDKDAAKAAVEDFAKECLERQTWANKAYEALATINDDNSFVLRLTVKEWTASSAGNHYYFRYAKNGAVADGQNIDCAVAEPTCVPSKSNDDLSLTTYTEGAAKEGKNGAKFYIGNCDDWGGCIMIVVVNEDAPAFKSVSLEVKDGKPYAVFNGTGKPTQEALLNAIIHLDAEDVSNGNAKPDGNSYVDENAIVNEETIIIEINAEAGTFKVYLLLEGENVKDGANFFFHLGAQGSDGYYPNVALKGDETANTITANGLTFTFATATDLGLTASWQANLLYIHVATAA